MGHDDDGGEVRSPPENLGVRVLTADDNWVAIPAVPKIRDDGNDSPRSEYRSPAFAGKTIGAFEVMGDQLAANSYIMTELRLCVPRAAIGKTLERMRL